MIGQQTDIIESTAGQVTAELVRRGILPQERVTIMIGQEPEIIPGRRETRARVVAAGLTDDDINALIKQARQEVHEEMCRETGLSPK
jgi:hypothetical protein